MTKKKGAAGAKKPAAPEGIAILGSHPKTVAEAPFEKNWLIYACSPHNFTERKLPRFDQWFEVHSKIADRTRPYAYLRELENVKTLWMRDKEEMKSFPGAQLYPEDEMKGLFCRYMFTSSIAYMAAKAIYDCCDGQTWRIVAPGPEKVKALLASDEAHTKETALAQATKDLYDEFGWAPPIPAIGFWGIMQASESEYTYQRPGIQYFIDKADDMGLGVFAPDISKLFHPPAEIW